MTDNVILRITVENTAPANGSFLTPFWFAFHDGGFNQLDAGSSASPGVERLAEDGTLATLRAEFLASGAGTAATAVFGAGGPIAAGETGSALLVLDADASSSRFVSYASMVIPSNDAFVANDDAMEHMVFDAAGNFLGTSFTIAGSEVWDAGTEVNTEAPADTAFFGQTVTDTGTVEGGVITNHPGFIPGGPILSSAMFAGADFTQPGYEIAHIRIEVVENGIGGTAGDDALRGDVADNLILAEDGNDQVVAGKGGDTVEGGAGNDILRGGDGDDWLAGGAGDDRLVGGEGADRFIFAPGGGSDLVRDFGAGDLLDLSAFGLADLGAALAAASARNAGVTFDLAGTSIFVRGVTLAEFSDLNVIV
ncbi:MAG: spondin domain-containing protein [Acetobacteraceae bacterium]|nr:spondin domain-containing protein [Acetobacteraceae bacterium]